MSPSQSSQSDDVQYLNQVAQTVDALVFSEKDLEESIAEIMPYLAAAYGLDDPALLEVEPLASHLAMANALGLVAALSNIRDVSDLEGLMLSIRFIDEDADYEGLRVLKGVALDKTLQAAVEHASLSLNDSRDVEVQRLTDLRVRAGKIMRERGYGGLYFSRPEVLLRVDAESAERKNEK